MSEATILWVPLERFMRDELPVSAPRRDSTARFLTPGQVAEAFGKSDAGRRDSERLPTVVRHQRDDSKGAGWQRQV